MLVGTGALDQVRRTAGGHRRISKAAVLRYKAASKERQKRGLDTMIESVECPTAARDGKLVYRSSAA
jgi:hypothetical protein